MVVVNKIAQANAGPDKIILEGQSIVLNGTAAGTGITYLWTPNNYISSPITLSPTVNPPVTQTYTLQVISNKGCGTSSDDVEVKVFKGLFIPNAFSPNNDGLNDTWNIVTLSAFPNATVNVYSRFGEKVFDNHGINKSWDGKFKGILLSPGAYPYIIDLKNNSPVIKGVVFIVF